MGIFTSKVERHKLLLIRYAESTIAEDERIYRNHVALFSAEYQEALPKAVGLLKARLHSSAFLAVAFGIRWGDAKPDDCLEALDAVSGLAVKPIVESGELSQESAADVGGPFFLQQLKFLNQELSDGPSSPGTGGMTSEQLSELLSSGALQHLPRELGIRDPSRLEQFISQGPVEASLTPGFVGLLESCHDALVESVGAEAYESCVWKSAQGRVVPNGIDAVKARPRFTRIFTGNILSRLRLLVNFQKSLS